MQYFVPLLLLITQVGVCQIEFDRDRLYTMLKQGRTYEVFKEANRIREKPYGKNALVDYFIAKSLCIDAHYKKSQEWFASIANNYPLDRESRGFIEEEKASCNNLRPASTALVSSKVYTLPLPKAGVSGRVGKGGLAVSCFQFDEFITFNDSISNEELLSRLFERDKQQEAYAKVKSLVGEGYQIDTSNRYIFVSLKMQDVDRRKVLAVADRLEKAYQFFVSWYGLRAPDKFITVYLMPDAKSLSAIAQRIHGLRLGENTIGYSLLADLSLLGIADAGTDNIGTLYHELWHMVVRTDVGDIPAWLDEGIATLYSVSYWDQDILYGQAKTWRLQDFKRLAPETVPSLVELIKYNWHQFNGGAAGNLCKAALNYAVSGHFMIYLQRKDKLRAAMQAFKNRNNPGDSSSPVAESDSSLLERIMDAKIAAIQQSFKEWFKKTYSFDAYEAVKKVGKPLAGYDFLEEEKKVESTLKELKTRGKLSAREYDKFSRNLEKIKNQYNKADNAFRKAAEKEAERNAHLEVANNVQQQQQQQQQQQVVIPASLRVPYGKREVIVKRLYTLQTKLNSLVGD